MRAWLKRCVQFIFPLESDTWLALFRIGLGLQTILYSLSLRNDWTYFFGDNGGLISRDLAEKLLSVESPFVPRLGWLLELGARIGLPEETVLTAAWLLLLCAGTGLLLGLFCRSAAIMAWLLHLCASKSGGVLSYGVDNFMTIGLFYLMLSPLPDQYALDRLWRKARLQDRQSLGFFRRMLQVHLCVIYFFSGLTKCLGSGWWDGSNIWRALVRPPSNLVTPEWLVHYKHLLPIAGVSICLVETSYAFFIWPNRTRAIWLIAILSMHAAIGLFMGMYLFAFVMIVLNVAAFAPDLDFSTVRPAIARLTELMKKRQLAT
jgi:hypothetical protein